MSYKEDIKMKHWFKFIVKGADGTYEGTEFVKAET